MKEKISICWLRRDLRLQDNTALYHALKSSDKVLLLFIFDTHILTQLTNKNDKRVAFIQETLAHINQVLQEYGSSLLVLYDAPLAAFEKINKQFKIKTIFANKEYEPYARNRDAQIKGFAYAHQITFSTFKDQVIFEEAEIMKGDHTPYTFYTPYSKVWKQKYFESEETSFPSENLLSNTYKTKSFAVPSLTNLGFKEMASGVGKPVIDNELIRHYNETRDLPAISGTSKLGVHLRFGTLSIRHLVKTTQQLNEVWLNELIWREFFMMILYHFPEVENNAFKKKYDGIRWRNNEEEFARWCKGETGYPLVDAGMREHELSGL